MYMTKNFLPKKVSVITVNYNQGPVTEALLDSIALYNHYEDIEIIVADNASKINPLPLWLQKYPNVKFIRSETNLGFAGGNNIALNISEGEYLFFINNDTEITPGLIEKMVAVMNEHPEIGMISPKIRYFSQPDLIQYAGFTAMNFYTGRNICIGALEQDKGQYDNAAGPTGFVHGAAMMVRREVVDKVGMMTENFFLYYEEMDWCERVKKAGYKIWIEQKALIYHKESVSVGKKSALKEYFMNRNRILFIRRHAPMFAKLIFFLHFATLVVPRNLLQYIKNNDLKLIPALFNAIWWNITNSTESTRLGYPVNKIQ